MLSNVRDIDKFSVHNEPGNIGQKRNRWLRAFEIYLEAGNIVNAARKRAQLSHLAGPEVQDIDEALPDPEAEGDVKTTQKLTEYFVPKSNEPYERHVFRNLSQAENEIIGQFMLRLRKQSQNCNFGQAENEMIRDVIIENCQSVELRRKLWKKGNTLTLDTTMETARLWESAQSQATLERRLLGRRFLGLTI